MPSGDVGLVNVFLDPRFIGLHANCRILSAVDLHISGRWLSRSPISQNGLALRFKSVENSTKLTYIEIAGFRIKHSTVLWLLELQIRRGRKI
jgi:hypothetical protein